MHPNFPPAPPTQQAAPTPPADEVDTTTDTPSGTTADKASAVGDVVQFRTEDSVTGAQLTGRGQVIGVDTDEDGTRRYTVARLDVLGGQLTDDDLVRVED